MSIGTARLAIPECSDDPTKYTLQNSTGVMVIHQLVMTVIEHVRSAGLSVIEPESYEKILATQSRQPLSVSDCES